ncbi:alpha/beta fold hydrolase [Adhaeribacter radiodurans]|uniref:Alpha/beta hydrolase n=1 Tax=Adhaeribacter radiodurans TaxID=2745197 RepID=A0A7L7LDM7_9BACT|nr:alpha/beta hydrolase [Adhaeribacter radiodurans]QMU30952.1 alpha/beta hydrolase [Adhaeribacter radiodurans]
MDVLKRNNVKVFGQGDKTLLFSHGFGCDQNMWRLITANFVTDYQIVLFDHVGAGNSDLSAYDKQKYNSLNGYAEDLLAICQALNLSNVILIGHSVGAMIGILSAIRQPEYFQKLILVGPSPCYFQQEEYYSGFTYTDIQDMLNHMETDYVNWSLTFAQFILGNKPHPAHVQEMTDSFCNTHPEIAKHFAQVCFLSDNRSDLALVKTKTYILQCSDDMIAPEEVGRFMSQVIEESVFIKLQATGHCPNLSSPLETTSVIESCLAD